MTILYNLRSTANGYAMAKFDDDFNLEATYNLTTTILPNGQTVFTCDCPAGARATCRHRKMIPIFERDNAVSTDRFYCYETQMWHRPVQTYGEGEASAERAVEVTSAIPPQPCEPKAAAQRIVEDQIVPKTGIRRI